MVIFTLALLLLLGPPAIEWLRVKGLIKQLQNDAGQLIACWQETGDVALPQVQQLRYSLEALDGEVRRLDRLLGPGADWLGRQTWWPWLARRGRLASLSLDAARDLSASAWWAVLRAESAVETYGQVNDAGGPAVTMTAGALEGGLNGLSEERWRLEQVRARALEAEELLRDMDGSLGDRAREASLAVSALDALLLAPELFGDGASRRFLVLIQNSDELRPTGGFISSVVVVETEGHRVTSWEYLNSYAIYDPEVTHPPASPALEKYMRSEQLVFRDANWSPDYPSSAEVMASLYALDRGEQVDGVLALDTWFVKLLLSALGPVPVPQYDMTITADNVMEQAVALWEAPPNAPSIGSTGEAFGQWLSHRKDFGSVFMQAMEVRVKSLDRQDIGRLAFAIQDAVEGKHLQIWILDNDQAQADLERAGMSGALRASEGDYLMIVDANVGWNKADANIERSIAYDVTLTPEGARATLRLTYRHLGPVSDGRCVHRATYGESYQEMTEQCYWNYVRVLCPAGSRLVSAEGSEEPVTAGSEEGKSKFATLLVVPPGEQRVLRLTYDLPAEALPLTSDGGAYRLLVQKQAGTQAPALQISVSLPEGLEASLQEPWAVDGNRYWVSEPLSRDRDYALQWYVAP